ncbi:MAG TPA: hypothetical protein VKD47_09020, partial [Miltoncostaeaceae bacterium]|nr:hypothetical protein [Miltoncostaeaceae bacterium]
RGDPTKGGLMILLAVLVVVLLGALVVARDVLGDVGVLLLLPLVVIGVGSLMVVLAVRAIMRSFSLAARMVLEGVALNLRTLVDGSPLRRLLAPASPAAKMDLLRDRYVAGEIDVYEYLDALERVPLKER